jgi:hypothetical protein
MGLPVAGIVGHQLTGLVARGQGVHELVAGGFVYDLGAVDLADEFADSLQVLGLGEDHLPLARPGEYQGDNG